jgi:hypothetical protein
MNNMTIRLRMLAYAIASAAVSLAFLTPCAASAAPAKKGAASPAKSSIYGTPAQLVEDLRSAGISIAEGRFTKLELLNKASVEEKYGATVYRFANGSLRFNEKTGEFMGFSLLAKQKPDLPVFPFKGMAGIVKLNDSGLLSRYGAVYASAFHYSDSKVSHTFYLLVPSPKMTIWSVILSVEAKGSFYSMIAFRDDTYSKLVCSEDITVGTAGLSGTALLLQDCWKLGLGLGMPSSMPDLMKRGVPPREKHPVEGRTLQFGAGEVDLSSGDDRVQSFFFMYPRHLSLVSLELFWERLVSGSHEYPLGDLKRLITKGPKAIEAHYGPGDQGKDKPLNLEYNILLDVGGAVGICIFNFDYDTEGDDSVVSVYGSFAQYNMYKVKAPAK